MAKIQTLQKDQELTMLNDDQKAYATEIDNFRLAAAEHATPEGDQVGFRLGGYYRGKDKRPLERGTCFAVVMPEVLHGYQKWEDKKPAGRVTGKIGDGFKVPPRETLGDNDRSAWQLGPDGKPKDPWVLTVYLALASREGDQLLTFVTSSHGGKQACYRLINNYAGQARKHPGQFPIIALEVDSYPNRRFSTTTFVPMFPIVDWIDREKLAVSSVTAEPRSTSVEQPRNEMDDEIPY